MQGVRFYCVVEPYFRYPGLASRVPDPVSMSARLG
jgi:hypothetical protein